MRWAWSKNDISNLGYGKACHSSTRTQLRSGPSYTPTGPLPEGSEAESDTESEDEDFDRDFDTAVRDAMAQHGTVTLSSTGFDRIMANARS